MTAADYSAAKPTCMAPVMTRQGQHGVHHRCSGQLRYHVPTNRWFCFACGCVVEGERVVARLCGY